MDILFPKVKTRFKDHLKALQTKKTTESIIETLHQALSSISSVKASQSLLNSERYSDKFLERTNLDKMCIDD